MGFFFSFDLKEKNTKNFSMWKAAVLSFITTEFLEMKWPWYKDIIRPETSGVNLFSLLSTVLKYEIKIYDSKFIIYVNVKGSSLRLQTSKPEPNVTQGKWHQGPRLYLIISNGEQYLFLHFINY